MIYNAFDVVVVPFPFTDLSQTKRRPALVLSSATHFNNQVRQSLMAMITTAKKSSWPLDAKILDLSEAGLKVLSFVRMKCFTLDHRLILSKLGALSERDRQAVMASVRYLLSDIGEWH